MGAALEPVPGRDAVVVQLVHFESRGLILMVSLSEF
jgi:hypothetical protein